MINPVANPTPLTPAHPYHPKNPQTPRYPTASTPSGEESGAPRWSRVEALVAAASSTGRRYPQGRSGIGRKCARLAGCETSPRNAPTSSTS